MGMETNKFRMELIMGPVWSGIGYGDKHFGVELGTETTSLEWNWIWRHTFWSGIGYGDKHFGVELDMETKSLEWNWVWRQPVLQTHLFSCCTGREFQSPELPIHEVETSVDWTSTRGRNN